MLPAPQRLTSSRDFRRITHQGVRAGRRTVVVHALPRPAASSRAGFVVSKAVGNAVTRNRVKRQLRHLTREAFEAVPTGVDIVVRALPAAADHDVRDDFRDAFSAALDKLAERD